MQHRRPNTEPASGNGMVAAFTAWRSRRKSRRDAEERRRRWAQYVNGDTATPHGPPVTPPVSHGGFGGFGGFVGAVDAAAERPTPATPDVARPVGWLRSVGQPAVTTLLATVTVVGGTPMVSGRWDPVLLAAGAAVSGTLAWLGRSVGTRSTNRQRHVAHSVAALIVVAAVAGTLTQTVVVGHAQLSGSRLDRAVAQTADARRAATVLADNQQLLTLSVEQAATIVDVYAAAIEQDLRIGERFNPATADEFPVDELVAVYELLNVAAIRQAAALDAYRANLANPETSLAAKADTLAAETALILDVELPSRFAAVDAAIATAARGDR